MADEDDKGAPVFDANKFKQEIIDTNKGLIDDLKGEVVSSMQAMLADHVEKISATPPAKREKVTAESMEDFRQELEGMGIDEEQGEAMMKMVNKLFAKQTKSLKDDVLKDVDEKQGQKETKQGLTVETLKSFPQIKDKTGALFKESKKIYNSMSAQVQASPEAELIAVERAALKLGIKPVNLEDENAFDSQNPMGGGGERKPRKKEMSADLAKYFNVDPKKVNEKLKEKGYFN